MLQRPYSRNMNHCIWKVPITLPKTESFSTETYHSSWATISEQAADGRINNCIQTPFSFLLYYSYIPQCSSNISECAIYPWSLVNDEDFSIWVGTGNRTYRFLSMDEDLAKNITMYTATVQLIFAMKEVHKTVLRYWVLCAFEEECMEPKGSHTGCHWNSYPVFGGDTYTIHGGYNLQGQSINKHHIGTSFKL